MSFKKLPDNLEATLILFSCTQEPLSAEIIARDIRRKNIKITWLDIGSLLYELLKLGYIKRYNPLFETFGDEIGADDMFLISIEGEQYLVWLKKYKADSTYSKIALVLSILSFIVSVIALFNTQ